MEKNSPLDHDKRFDAFTKALDDLCRSHGVQLSVDGYDGLQVWPLRTGESPVHAPYIETLLDFDKEQ